VALADEAGPAGGDPDMLVPGSSGVLITGSVITAGDAKALLSRAAPPALPEQPPAPPSPGEPDEPGELGWADELGEPDPT
jgi:hypothetical protein